MDATNPNIQPNEQDEILRFAFANGDIRGVAATVDQSWQRSIAQHDYPPVVTELLGQSLAAAACMVAGLKFDGRLVLQFSAGGPLSLLVVQMRSDYSFRVTAKCDPAFAWQDRALTPADLLQQGQLVLTLEPVKGQAYQSVVGVQAQGDPHAALAEAIEGYFANSEQLPTRLVLAANAARACAIMTQRMPQSGGRPAAGDAFDYAVAVLDTAVGVAGRQELLDTSLTTMLHRLFHEQNPRLLAVESLRFVCQCSRQRVGSMLAGLGAQELNAALDESPTPGQIEIRCEFCNTPYHFDQVDIGQLLAQAGVAPPGGTRH